MRKNHIYPHLKYNRELVEQAYQDHLKIFNSMTPEEKEKKGFGKDGHAHPRRFFIFLHKYLTEIKYFMNDKERDTYVFPWIVATRSERLNALKKSHAYFDLKKTTLKLAKTRYENYKLDQEIKQLKNKQ